jgi:uncharacterized membrane protein HdeD (DUF308 family)
MSSQSTNVFSEAAGTSIGWSVVMIILGFVATVMPIATGIGISILVGWAMVLGGFSYLAYAFAAQGAGSFIWRVLVGAFYIVGGGYLAFHPGLTLASLTLLVAAIFLVEGITEVVTFFQFSSIPGSGWTLFDGIVTIFLAYMIWRPWPVSSVWAIGTLVGVNLIFSGFTRLMYSVGAKKTIQAIA